MASPPNSRSSLQRTTPRALWGRAAIFVRPSPHGADALTGQRTAGTREARPGSVAQAGGHLAAVLGELLPDRFQQGDILFRRPVRTRVDAQFLGEILARLEIGLQIEQLQQIDDRGAPVSAAALALGDPGQDLFDIRRLGVRGGRRSRSRGGRGRGPFAVSISGAEQTRSWP